MPRRVLREYFKSIFWPMKFTDRELEEARVEKGKRDEENREKDRRYGQGTVTQIKDVPRLEDVEEAPRAATLRLYKAVADVSKETEPGVLQELIRSG